MSGTSKIDKWNLSSEVVLLHEDGFSNVEIAKRITNGHPERSISTMAVGRFLSAVREEEVENRLEALKDPAKFIMEEFDSKIRTNIQDSERMNDLVKDMTNKLRNDKDNISIDELNKIVTTWAKTNDRVRMNLIALRQFADSQIIKPVQNVIFKKETNIKTLILDVSRGLCPECKRKVQEQISEYSKR